MYTFEDRGGDSLTLRPEATACVLRAYIEHGFQVQPKPVRLYTMGPMFRYERPQAGRYRQFHQANVEALGETHPALDAEVIAMLMDFFGALGLADRLELRVNSIGDAGTRPVYVSRLVEYLGPHRSGLCGECQARMDRNPLRVLDCKTLRLSADHREGALDPRLALARGDGALRQRATEPRRHGDRSQGRPRLVRGLDYYVRTTFEVLTTELGAQNAVAGGGRYDGLIAQLGGPADPGIGFAIGLERVVAAPRRRGPRCRPCRLAHPPRVRPRCNACCPRRAAPARAACRWSWVTASGSCPESSSGPIGSVRRGR